jgi:hypothetical protein
LEEKEKEKEKEKKEKDSQAIEQWRAPLRLLVRKIRKRDHSQEDQQHHEGEHDTRPQRRDDPSFDETFRVVGKRGAANSRHAEQTTHAAAEATVVRLLN